MQNDEIRAKIYAIVMGLLRDMKADKIGVEDVKNEFCKRFDQALKAAKELSDEDVDEIVKGF